MYPKFAKEILDGTGKSVKFIHFKITDMRNRPDEVTIQFVEELASMVYAGEVLYIHCRGGHGRTGLISAQLMMALYGIPQDEAIENINFYHQTRCIKADPNFKHKFCQMPEY